ncbi:MAG: adenine phosphoribosyltransferase [Thermoplasmata archaeon]|nr:adenine phosphoribosyltransferase [Thermoplasmata archaeon]MBE3136263.1 adenine phosphoribosyltransferase [Thermoplasmata archaeon]
MTESIKSKIRTIPDWPKKNIMFRDITTLLKSPDGLKETIDLLYNRYADKEIDKVVGIESRGFIVAAPLAYRLGCGFVPVRKPGKLPAECESEEYSLEYGKDKIEIHKDAINKGDKVLIVDDLLATGGTMNAARNLVKKLEGEIVECAFVVELPDLKGREKIKGENIFSIVKFEGE